MVSPVAKPESYREADSISDPLLLGTESNSDLLKMPGPNLNQAHFSHDSVDLQGQTELQLS